MITNRNKLLSVLWLLNIGIGVTAGDCSKDIVFVLDSSSSVGWINYMKMLEFCKDVLTNADADSADFRVGILSYSTEVNIGFYMNKYTKQQDIYKAIENITYWHGDTNTAEGLKTMNKVMFTVENGDRPNVDDVAIVLTDGASNINSNRTIPEAEAAREMNIHIYAIGIGLIERKEILGIASYPPERNAYFLQDFDELKGFARDLYSKICPVRNISKAEEMSFTETSTVLSSTQTALVLSLSIICALLLAIIVIFSVVLYCKCKRTKSNEGDVYLGVVEQREGGDPYILPNTALQLHMDPDDDYAFLSENEMHSDQELAELRPDSSYCNPYMPALKVQAEDDYDRPSNTNINGENGNHDDHNNELNLEEETMVKSVVGEITDDCNTESD